MTDEQFSAIPWWVNVPFRREDEICYVLDKDVNANSPKQQSASRHVAPLW